MQQLHLVGLTTDHTGLILSARRGAKTGKYTVAADEKLLAAVKEAQRLLGGGDAADDDNQAAVAAVAESLALPSPPPAKPVSSLSPREIQARLRAGGTVSDIAAAAGVDEEWILRFADPIRAEQARVVERAQRLTFNKSRLGPSAEPLETSVLLNLAERGVRLPADIFATAWTAFNLHGTSWAVLFSYTSRQRRQTAQWEVDLRSGEATARNRLASDLGYLEPGRRRRRMEPLEVPGEEDSASAGRPAAAKGAAERASVGAPGKALRPPAAAGKKAGGPVRSAAKRPAAKRPAAARASGAGKAPAKKSTMATRASAAKKAARATKATATSRTPAPNKAAATTTTKATGAAVAKRAPAAKKGGSREAPRGRRPAKKPAAEKPAPQEAGTGVATPPAAPPPVPTSDRPTHLARPPSPMNLSNRAVTLPGRLVGAPSLRPPLRPSPSPEPPLRRQPSPRPSSSRPRPRHDAAEEIGFAPDREEAASANGRPTRDRPPANRPKDQPSASPAAEADADADADAAGGGTGRGRGTGGDTPATRAGGGEGTGQRPRRRRSERRITPRDGEQPSVVILSTPAVRRLEPAEETRRRPPAPRS